MNKIAVFGKPGSGKSRLSRLLADETGIPLHHLDSMTYKRTGELVDKETFTKAHQEVVSSAQWIIDGLGPMDAFNQRLESADTLIYIDLPYLTSYWFVTKRLFKGLLVKPEGWPDGSSVFKGTLQSYKVLRLCPKFWNDNFTLKLQQLSAKKSLYIIRSVSELNSFIERNIK